MSEFEQSQTNGAPLPLAIAGMHRSGTSMVAKLLQQAGLYLGPESDLMPPAEQNPEGFFEHLGFVRLNDEVLNVAGAGWDCPPPADVDWSSEPFAPYRQRARHLGDELGNQAPWGFKDPRTSLTLPFWRSALGPLRTIVVVRNPLEVVTSLHRRDGFSIALSLTLWRTYAERVLRDTSPADRLVTHFDAYFLQPEREIARVLGFAGLDESDDITALRQATVTGLRHHRKTTRDLEEHGFPADVIDLYRALCREADWWEAGEPVSPDATYFFPPSTESVVARGLGGVDLLRVENEALRRNNADFTAALAEREIRIQELETALQGQEVARSELEGRILERDSRLHERNGVIARRDQAITAMQQQIALNAAELNRVRAENAALRERFEASERRRLIAERHERELRVMLTDLHEIQLQRDAQIMGTLGAVLSRHAPGAPASIYYRKLVDQVRRIVDAHVPVEARVLVASYGDPALLRLGARATEHFPRSAPGISADYTDVRDDDAIAQLASLADNGAEYLVVPGPAIPWLTNHPELQRYLEDRYTTVFAERGVVTIYALNHQQAQIPA